MGKGGGMFNSNVCTVKGVDRHNIKGDSDGVDTKKYPRI